MRKLSAIAITAFMLAGIQSAAADEIRTHPTAVLELFTSQGCSSCPPADKVLESYADQDAIIALAYHVDYWDYIGWADTFGSADNSDFQRAYAQAQNKSSIYTPQLMINGTADIVGSRRDAAASAVAGARLELPVAISARQHMLDISIAGKSGLPESVVWLVTFKSGADVKIERGENAGRNMHYAQIVTGRQMLGMWDPVNGTHIKLPLDELLNAGSDGAAVIVQQEKKGLPGPILGAASFCRDMTGT